MRRSITISTDEVNYWDDVKTDLPELFADVNRDIKKRWKTDYYNIPVCFDIETSSFCQQNEKRACMYIWMFSIDDNIIIGRTWEDFLFLCDSLVKEFSLHWKFRRMVIYIQNLSYEFQWFCQYFKWKKVFALSNRIPLSALTESGLEFRCSYRLSGYNLAKIGENLVKYKVSKMVGDLDYNKIRHSGTPLTDKEMGYCINDVRVLSAYIREKIEHDGSITKIPLTKTGYVRLYCREHIYADHRSKQFKHYRQLMQKLTIELDEYKLLREGFQGGFTHANAYHVGKTLHDMESEDYCSKYPSIMIARKLPMGKGEKVFIKDRKTFEENLKKYCCIFRIHFIGLNSKILYENYISYSKCRNISKPVLNNGRVVSAAELETTITNLDYEIIKECYTWDHIEIGTFYRYKKAYLPTEFVKCILEFYRIKTELKGLEGKEIEYLQGKENLNSCYGMAVTSILRDQFTFSNEESDLGAWSFEKPDPAAVIDKYNNSINRFLFFPWGVWITAESRYDIWFHGILKVKDDYVYSDTDSIKFLHPEKHQDFTREFNNKIGKELLKAMRHHKLDPELIAPKTINGKPKPLGVYELDGKYKRFKTLGAKRYIYEDEEGKINMVVAGLPKKSGKAYISKYKDPFKIFTKDMNVPITESGKQTATYIDYETSGHIIDYLGNEGYYHEMSSINLDATSYNMSLAGDYVKYLMSINDDFEF